MKKYNYFKDSEFEAKLSFDERNQVMTSPILQEYRNELRARMNIIRMALNMPIKINSWYRDKAHNEKAGGSPTSQHLDGSACDITSSNNQQLLQVIKQLSKDGMDFGQVIAYGFDVIRFIHISLPTRQTLNQFLYYE